jgi:hypothetical protein
LPEELDGSAVTWLPENGSAQGTSTLVRLDPDGGFAFQCPAGPIEIFVVDATPGSWRGVLGRQGLDVDHDVENLIVPVDPLVEAPR